MLVKETACKCGNYLSTYIRDKLEEKRVKNFHILVLRGKIRTVALCIEEQYKGGEMQMIYACNKTGSIFLACSGKNTPMPLIPWLAVSMPTLTDLQNWSLLNRHTKKVIEVAWSLSGGAGPGGTNSISLQHWLFHLG